MPLIDFLTESEQRRIVAAIGDAEKCTSGEIRVHIEPKCRRGDAMKRAEQVFNHLRMYETRERNAVLIYLAYESRVFAIIGDCGIHSRVPADYWDGEKELLLSHLKQGRAADGICAVIASIGKRLAEYFPWTDNDINEQSDEISYSE
ncbi:MAG: TPM domain-containing protein [bacterium]|nr:TPM domain-containing protein [bacterium]